AREARHEHLGLRTYVRPPYPLVYPIVSIPRKAHERTVPNRTRDRARSGMKRQTLFDGVIVHANYLGARATKRLRQNRRRHNADYEENCEQYPYRHPENATGTFR